MDNLRKFCFHRAGLSLRCLSWSSLIILTESRHLQDGHIYVDLSTQVLHSSETYPHCTKSNIKKPSEAVKTLTKVRKVSETEFYTVQVTFSNFTQRITHDTVLCVAFKKHNNCYGIFDIIIWVFKSNKKTLIHCKIILWLYLCTCPQLQWFPAVLPPLCHCEYCSVQKCDTFPLHYE